MVYSDKNQQEFSSEGSSAFPGSSSPSFPRNNSRRDYGAGVSSNAPSSRRSSLGQSSSSSSSSGNYRHSSQGAGSGNSRRHNNNQQQGGGGGVNRNQPNVLNRSYESTGPDHIKVRGTLLQICEKYQQYARDIYLAGNRILAESFYQHAEHYFRLLLFYVGKGRLDSLGLRAQSLGYKPEFISDLVEEEADSLASSDAFTPAPSYNNKPVSNVADHAYTSQREKHTTKINKKEQERCSSPSSFTPISAERKNVEEDVVEDTIQPHQQDLETRPSQDKQAEYIEPLDSEQKQNNKQHKLKNCSVRPRKKPLRNVEINTNTNSD